MAGWQKEGERAQAEPPAHCRGSLSEGDKEPWEDLEEGGLIAS